MKLVWKERVVSMRTQLNGLEQPDNEELAKTIANEFGRGEITGKKKREK